MKERKRMGSAGGVGRAAIGLALVLLISPPGQAGEPDSRTIASQHFEAATRLFEVEDFEGAAAEFEMSLRLYPTKNAYFNLANCYKALHRYQDALEAVDRLEAEFGEALDRTMRRKANDLRELIASLVGVLDLETHPPDAEVRLDGRPLSQPTRTLPIQLGPGEHELEVRAEGYETVVKRLTIHAQKRRALRVALVPLTGTLAIQTDVDGATVLMDGNYLGETPLEPAAVQVGRHLVEVSLNGYRAQSREVRVGPESWTNLAFRLEADETDGAEPWTVSASQSHRARSPYKGLKIAGIALAATSAVLAGTFYGLAAAKASSFADQDDAYLDATDRADIEAADAARREAKRQTEGFAAAGLATTIGAGVFGVAAVVFSVLDKKSEKRETALSLEGGRFSVRF